MGAKYGHGLNRLSQAVFALLERLYANVPPAHNPTRQERNRIVAQRYASRNDQIRTLFASGTTLKELAEQFGISIGRVHQIVHAKQS